MNLILSEQDLDLLHHIARGQTYRQAGEALGVTEQTVKNRIHLLLPTFGAHHVAHLIAICIASDIVRVADLYQEAEVIVRSYDRRNHTTQSYALHPTRLAIQQAVIA